MTDRKLWPPTIYCPEADIPVSPSFIGYKAINFLRSPLQYIHSGTFSKGHLWVTWSKVLGCDAWCGREVGPLQDPGDWRYRHHLRNKIEKRSPLLCLMCFGWGKPPAHSSGLLQPGCAGKAGSGGQLWRSPPAVPTRAKRTHASQEASLGHLRPLS